MKQIEMTIEQVEAWSAQFNGDRDQISYDGTYLHVPDELFDAISAIDIDDSAAVLMALKVFINAEIDKAAELQRLLYITPGAGQSMVYRQKEMEAELVVADPQIAPALVPHIAAEAVAFDTSLFDCAVVVLTMAQQWRTVSSGIETTRLVAKATVDAAATPEEARAVLETIVWSGGASV